MLSANAFHSSLAPSVSGSARGISSLVRPFARIHRNLQNGSQDVAIVRKIALSFRGFPFSVLQARSRSAVGRRD